MSVLLNLEIDAPVLLVNLENVVYGLKRRKVPHPQVNQVHPSIVVKSTDVNDGVVVAHIRFSSVEVDCRVQA